MADNMQTPLIELKDIYKIYYMGDEEVRANDGINLTIHKGEFVAIVGKSGYGHALLWIFPTPDYARYCVGSPPSG